MESGRSPVGASDAQVESCLGLARGTARAFLASDPGTPELDDLVGAALLALVRAARSWNPAGGAAFKSWAALHVRGALISERRVRLGRYLDKPRVLSLETEPEGARPDLAADDRELVARLLSVLPPRPRRVVEERFLGGRSATEVARALGTSQQNVSGITAKAFARMRREAERLGLR